MVDMRYQSYDAFGKLQVGDVVVGINGHRVGAADELKELAEEYIQHPKESKTVTFTILRDGQEYDVKVEKSIDELAIVKVYNLRNTGTITYDVDRGILLAAEASFSHNVAFTSLMTEAFLIVDDYGGFSKFGYLAGKTAYQTHFGSDGVAWTLSLIE
jgi:hypothetical protein